MRLQFHHSGLQFFFITVALAGRGLTNDRFSASFAANTAMMVVISMVVLLGWLATVYRTSRLLRTNKPACSPQQACLLGVISRLVGGVQAGLSEATSRLIGARHPRAPDKGAIALADCPLAGKSGDRPRPLHNVHESR